MREIPDHGLMLDGHDTARGDVLVQARAALLNHGLDAWDADEMLAERPNLLVRTWWGGEAGFVQADHPDAVPVTVVNVRLEV